MRFAHRAVPVCIAAAFVDVIGLGSAMPVLPRLITQLAHTDVQRATKLAGWLLAVFAAAQVVAGPVLGSIADRWGRRPVLIAALLAFAADYSLTALAPTMMWLFIGRAVAGVAGATLGPLNAVLADVSAPEDRAKTFGLLGASYGAGLALGPAIGGLTAHWGVRAPFWLAAGLALLNALAMIAFLPETLAHENRRPFSWAEANLVGALKPLLGVAKAGPLLFAWFLWQIGGYVYPATWSFWATLRFGWSAVAIGWSLAWMGVIELIVQVTLTERMVRRLGEWGAGLLGLLCSAATLAICAAVTSGWQVYAALSVGALSALAWPALNGRMSQLVDETRQGVLQGGMASLDSVAAVIGPPLATQSFTYGSARGMMGGAFLVGASLMGIAGLIIAWRVPRARPEPVTVSAK